MHTKFYYHVAGRAMAKPRQGDEKNGMTLTRRVCDRCKKTYATTEDGDAIVSEVCNYHWGRKFNTMSKFDSSLFIFIVYLLQQTIDSNNRLSTSSSCRQRMS